MKIKSEKDRIVACVIGDGGTSKGDFYESLNFSCIHRLPVLYVINANNWAISTPFSSQSATSLVHKFSGFGAEISEVSGLDFDVISNSVDMARKAIINNKKPFILICHTQRLDPHTVLDDFHKYADKEHIEKLRSEHDPVSTYINLQLSNNKITSEDVETLYTYAKKLVDDSANELINFNPEPISPQTHLFCYV